MSLLFAEPSQFGKLVALEGDSEVIDTQLRLLPPSQKILILPALPDVSSSSSNEVDFNARTFIRGVHTVFTERNEKAWTFLRSSTSMHPRLVIQNGGSVSARATCISKIASITDGDFQSAEKLFNEIVKDGVAGLMRQDVSREDLKTAVENVDRANAAHSIEYPTARATEAVDPFDRETEGKQPDSVPSDSIPPETPADSDGIVSSLTTIPDSINGMLKKAVLPSQGGDDIVRTILTLPNRSRRFTLEEKRTTFGPQYSMSTPATASTFGPVQDPEDIEEDDGDFEFLSPGAESMFSVPPTPAVYAEALLVDVQSATPSRTVRKTQSVDKFHTRTSAFLVPRLAASPLKHTASDYHLRLRASNIPEVQNYETLPRTTFVKASQTTIRRSPTLASSIRSSSTSNQVIPPCVYVERGEDALSPTTDSSEEPFVPVFPITEDLIIHLVDDNGNALLESLLKSHKEARYPIMPTTAELSKVPEESAVPVAKEQDQNVLRPSSYLTAETDDMGYERKHGLDPREDSHPPDINRQWPPMPKRVRLGSLGYIGPPTPALTSATHESSLTRVAEKFVDFTPTKPDNAINVQDSLRHLLSLHFPIGENGYSQHYYPVSPEADRLWKPVFRNDQSIIIGNDGRNVDQIIALGYEEGVKRDFFFQISGQVEKLGSKRDGFNRGGKLDIRYLISNVMQYFSVFSTQSPFNPLSNPQTLAALLVPQIEAYLAINASTRLLVLQYPASHLPTIFALRKLLGSDLLKVGGILNSLASDPPSMSRTRSLNPLSNEAVSKPAQNQAHLTSSQKARAESAQADAINNLQQRTSSTGFTGSAAHSVHFGLGSKSPTSFAKADYVLPSTATDAEITTFLSTIWKFLMEKSAFYTPEPEPKPIIVERPPMPPPPTPTGSKRDRAERDRERHRDSNKDTDKHSSYHPSHRHRPTGSQAKISRLTGGTATGTSIPRSNYSTSVNSAPNSRPSNRRRDQNTDYDPSLILTEHKYATSVASNKTTHSEKERRRDKEWENFYIGDVDSEDDEYDKMIMGRAGQKIVPEPEIKIKTMKRDKRKALKWLGLA